MHHNHRFWGVLVLAVLILCACQSLATTSTQLSEPVTMVHVDPIIAFLQRAAWETVLENQ